MGEAFRLHAVGRTAVATVVEMTNHRPTPVPFDVHTGLGELCDEMLDVIRTSID